MKVSAVPSRANYCQFWATRYLLEFRSRLYFKPLPEPRATDKANELVQVLAAIDGTNESRNHKDCLVSRSSFPELLQCGVVLRFDRRKELLDQPVVLKICIRVPSESKLNSAYRFAEIAK